MESVKYCTGRGRGGDRGRCGGLLPGSAVSGFTGLRNQSSFWFCDYRVKNQG